MALKRSRGDGGRRADDINPFTQPAFVASAVLLALVVLIGVVMSVIFANQDDGAPRSVAPDPVPAAGGLPGQGAVSLAPATGTATPRAQNGLPDEMTPCPQFPQEQDDAVSQEPPRITWSSFRTVLLPSSAALGPKVQHGGVARCYAHSPTGALLAVSQITTRYFLSGDWRSVLDLQVVPGPGRDAYRDQQAAAEGDNGSADAPQAGQINQFAGYRFVTYTAETAVIQMVRRTPDGKMMGAIHTVVWVDGDWRLQMQSDGSDSSVRQEITSLAGFQKWAGV